MPTELGNELVDQGIKLISLYVSFFNLTMVPGLADTTYFLYGLQAGTDFGLLMSSQRDHATDKVSHIYKQPRSYQR